MHIKTKIEKYEEDYEGNLSFLSHMKGDIKNVVVSEVNFCCDEMSDAFTGKEIFFGEYNSYGLNKNTMVNFIGKAFISGGELAVDEIPINYCPFCGSVIAIE